MHALSRIDKLFSDPFFSFPLAVHHNHSYGMAWSPRIDVHETPEHVEVSVEVPGVAPEHIDASVTGNILTIKGEKSREVRKTDDNGQDRLVERSYGSFNRRIRLPAYVDHEAVSAHSEHGVLKITFKKRDLPKKIDINLN